MLNRQLETFITTADAGSFLKAAEKLYISPTAVTKQINTLEHNLGITLFERTYNGLKLTKAGESFYQDAKYMIHYLHEAVERAKNAMQSNVIRVGISPMSSSSVLLEIWPQISKFCPDINFQLVPYENTAENARGILDNIGKRMDIVMGVFDSLLLESGKCLGLKLFEEKLCCGVSRRHPLAAESELTIQDLYGQRLLLLERGGNRTMDKLRDEIEKHHPAIQIENIPFYDISAFNRCEASNCVLIMAANWGSVHPLIKTIPVDWNYTVSIGFLYALQPSAPVQSLVSAVTQARHEEIG